MTDWIDSFIASLRDELQEYGEMLARLEEQQELIASRKGDALLDSISKVERQAHVLKGARLKRENICSQILGYLELPKETPVREALAHFPAEYHPLIRALIDENAELLVRIQRQARQNHLLLLHSMEAMQRLIHSLGQEKNTTLYSMDGRAPLSAPSTMLYEAVG